MSEKGKGGKLYTESWLGLGWAEGSHSFLNRSNSTFFLGSVGVCSRAGELKLSPSFLTGPFCAEREEGGREGEGTVNF